MHIEITLPEDNFVSYCSETIRNKKQTIEKSLSEGIIYAVREALKGDIFVSASYRYVFELYDKCLSLREYIETGCAALHYFEIKIECRKTDPLPDMVLCFPSYIVPGDMGRNYPHAFEAEHHLSAPEIKAPKTKPKYIFKPREIRIPKPTLEKIYSLLPDMDFLLPSKFAPAGDWRQTFYNVKTGEAFLCNCFKKAMQNKPPQAVTHPHIKSALNYKSYLIGICHLCTKTTPPILCGEDQKTFSFKRTYGPYIFKTMYKNKKEISFKEAENIVRELVGYPLVGEGWVSEALLFNFIKDRFPEVEVIQHGQPSFLGEQHYDVWIPELKIAVEFQGEQHRKPVEYFGGEAAFAAQQERDKRKRKVSAENGVTLICIEDGRNYSALLKKIEAAIG